MNTLSTYRLIKMFTDLGFLQSSSYPFSPLPPLPQASLQPKIVDATPLIAFAGTSYKIIRADRFLPSQQGNFLALYNFNYWPTST